MTGLKLALSPEEYHRLPRNAAYKYEYLEGTAYLSPRPKYFHALLDLAPLAQGPLSGAASALLRPVRADDWEGLAPLFGVSFRGVVPFAGLEDDARREAARQSLALTRSGGDGPWIERASFVAEGETGRPVGAILITLLPDADPSRWDAFCWPAPPPADCIERCQGRPHLTWIFIHPVDSGRGLATALLNAAVRALLLLGYKQLASTILLGNDASMLWHWRCGFRLATYPGSRRNVPRSASS